MEMGHTVAPLVAEFQSVAEQAGIKGSTARTKASSSRAPRSACTPAARIS